MQYCWAEFHQNKSVFLEFRGLKNTIKASKLAVQRLKEEQNLALASPAEGMAGPIRQNLGLKRKRKEVELRREERDTRHEIIQKTSHFNFIKMHLPVHYRDHVK